MDRAVFERALGAAVASEWGSLKREDQERIFLAALSAGQKGFGGGTDFRDALAAFLHEIHPRTHHEE